jgi:hypothetical protein
MKIEEVNEVPEEPEKPTALTPPSPKRKRKEKINPTTAAEGFAFIFTLIARGFGYDYEWDAKDFQRTGKDFADNIGEHADILPVRILIFLVARAATIKELYDNVRQLIMGIRQARLLRKAKEESIDTDFHVEEEIHANPASTRLS